MFFLYDFWRRFHKQILILISRSRLKFQTSSIQVKINSYNNYIFIRRKMK